MEKIVWYLALLLGWFTTVLVGELLSELAAGMLVISVYLLCLIYGLFQATRARRRDFLLDLGITIVPYGILAAYYHPPFLSPDEIVWLVFGIIAILSTTNLAILYVERRKQLTKIEEEKR